MSSETKGRGHVDRLADSFRSFATPAWTVQLPFAIGLMMTALYLDSPIVAFQGGVYLVALALYYGGKSPAANVGDSEGIDK